MKRILPISLLLFSLSAHANGIKDLFLDALQHGSSEGFVTDNIESVFKNATKSDQPIHIKIKRIQQFEHGCGRLRAEIKQSGVKNEKGDLTTIDPWFELNICPDGNPPLEKIKEMQIKQQAMLKACKVSIEKMGQDKESGATKAFLRATGCPDNGMSHWRYTGDCSDLKMPDNVSTNTPFTKDGKVNIELRIPMQCLPKQNSWSALIENKDGFKIGDVQANW
jgi:hypothetical protein